MNFNNRCFLLFFWWGSWKHFAIEFDLIYIPIIICHIARVEECEAMILVLPHSANPHLCRDKNDLFTTLQVSESNTNLGYDIKPIIGDGYCVIQSFQEMKSFHIWSYSGPYFPTFYIQFESGTIRTRKILNTNTLHAAEIMKNYNFYSKFSTKNSNVLLELSITVKTPLTYFW